MSSIFLITLIIAIIQVLAQENPGGVPGAADVPGNPAVPGGPQDPGAQGPQNGGGMPPEGGGGPPAAPDGQAGDNDQVPPNYPEQQPPREPQDPQDPQIPPRPPPDPNQPENQKPPPPSTTKNPIDGVLSSSLKLLSSLLKIGLAKKVAAKDAIQNVLELKINTTKALADAITS